MGSQSNASLTLQCAIHHRQDLNAVAKPRATSSNSSAQQVQAAVYTANAQTDANLASISASANSQREQVQGPNLRSHTIQPGDDHGGAIYFDSISPSGGDVGKLVISVSIDNEAHTFAMDVKKVDY